MVHWENLAIYIFYPSFIMILTQQKRLILSPVLRKRNLMHGQSGHGVVSEKAEDRGQHYSEAIREGTVGAQAHSLGPLEAGGLSPCQKQVFVPSSNGRVDGNIGLCRSAVEYISLTVNPLLVHNIKRQVQWTILVHNFKCPRIGYFLSLSRWYVDGHCSCLYCKL